MSDSSVVSANPYTFHAPEGWDPDEAIIRNLTAKTAGELYDAQEVACASLVLGAAMLVSRGLGWDLATKIIDQAAEHGRIHVSYDGRAIDVSIGKDDAEDPDSGDFDDPCDFCDGGWVDDPMGLGGPTVCHHCGGAG